MKRKKTAPKTQAIKQGNGIQYYPSQVHGISADFHSHQEYVLNIKLSLSLIKSQIWRSGQVTNVSTIQN